MRAVRDDYRSWRNLGPGGLPANPLGWACTTLLRPFGRDGTIAAVDAASDLDLPFRRGERPTVAPHPVPHRQVAMDAEPDTVRALERHLLAVADDPSFRTARSRFERRGDALFLADTADAPPWIRQAGGELAHVHTGQGSLHVVADPGDAEVIVSRGWGERHPLAGRRMLGLPYSYVFLYAPRDGEDLSTVLAVVDRVVRRASAGGQ
ncbi:hypothetical protein ASG56_02835 [Rhodococcus sp. Leaf7]|uniref:luciferase domain-containing protein n=1 Tax=unclassified Rhodococcus (in: high G+C Gram-positive bacteria) TaxID=192944 RepID=UPI0006F4082E|nr:MULTISPECIES: hypothetical protein [unclassified Rhodococcus (in: high G+C Gram-positive bacteria)]KQU06604.1 hypothetical protein ASG56_02835 [Rhodococcus sp. Leaf7]KQU42123.1 hypothetical protein ASG64_02835 [Rhodococcus sp. Leaf247]